MGLIVLPLEMHDIQGDLLVGMQKNAELFLFFRITNARRFEDIAKRQLISRVTTALTVNERERRVAPDEIISIDLIDFEPEEHLSAVPA
jgi:hypothetical protein